MPTSPVSGALPMPSRSRSGSSTRRSARTSNATSPFGARPPYCDTSGRHWNDGYLRRVLTTRQTPSLAEYDSRSASTISSHFQWAQQYGVGVFICSWWGANSYEDVTIRDNLIASPAIGPTKIAVMY